MGARLVIPAVEFVDRNSANVDSSNISNIILSSPDVDRQDFERDIIEEVLSARRVNNDRRITIYASAKDKALAISRSIHGYPRLGSPYCFDTFEAASLKAAGLPERCFAAKGRYTQEPSKSGLTIIDTSEVSSGGSGHSDYLRSPAACRDFIATIKGQRDGVAGRVATQLPHVFRLTVEGKKPKSEVDPVCMLAK
jgi:esterase/lipase superfamily enzyme